MHETVGPAHKWLLTPLTPPRAFSEPSAPYPSIPGRAADATSLATTHRLPHPRAPNEPNYPLIAPFPARVRPKHLLAMA